MPDDARRKDSTGTGLSLTTSVVGAVLALAMIISLALLTEELYELDEHVQSQLAIGGNLEGAVALPAEQARKGVAVYLPAVGSMRSSSGQELLLETRLSVRNTDPQASLQITTARAFDREGRELASLLTRPQEVGPMQALLLPLHSNADQASTARLEIASFVLEWSADGAINRPLIEAILIGKSGSIVIRRGKPIERW